MFGSVTDFVVGVVSVNKIIFNIVKMVLASVRILKGLYGLSFVKLFLLKVLFAFKE